MQDGPETGSCGAASLVKQRWHILELTALSNQAAGRVKASRRLAEIVSDVEICTSYKLSKNPRIMQGWEIVKL